LFFAKPRNDIAPTAAGLQERGDILEGVVSGPRAEPFPERF